MSIKSIAKCRLFIIFKPMIISLFVNRAAIHGCLVFSLDASRPAADLFKHTANLRTFQGASTVVTTSSDELDSTKELVRISFQPRRSLIKMALAAIGVSVLVVSCSEPKKTESIIQPDPVADLKAIIKKSGKEDNNTRTEWRDVNYDVRKSDSLVSPYIATIKANVFEYKKINGVEIKFYDRHEHDISLAYQDNKWIIKEIVCSCGTFTSDGSFLSSVRKNEKLSSSDSHWQLIEYDMHLK